MDSLRRRELKEQYKQVKTNMGIIQIKNNVNGKIYIMSCANLKNRWMNIREQLVIGRFFNLELQKEWKEYGEAAFTYEVLEEKEAEKDEDNRFVLKQLENAWLEKLQPYGGRGYNKPSSN